MVSLRALLPFIFLGLFQSIFLCCSGEEILQFCKKHNITLSELEDEAKQAGISISTLISMMNAEYPSPIEEHVKNKVDPNVKDPCIDSPTGNEDVLGFVPSSSVIYSSDILRNTTIEEPTTKVDSEQKVSASLDTETLKLSEKTLFVNNADTRASSDKNLKTSESCSCSKRKHSSETGKCRVIIINASKKNRVKCTKDINAKRNEVGKRYYIINKNGEREEYKVVSHHQKKVRKNKDSKANKLKRVEVVNRHIQPVIIAQPSIAPLYAPMQVPQMPGHPGYVTPPQIPRFPTQGPPQVPPQVPPQAPQMPPPTRDNGDFEYMNKNYNGSDNKNSFIGPLTISVIVIILIISCIIGGFCFCGATGANRNHGNMPLIPPPGTPNAPQNPPYNSRAPIVPQNQPTMQPPPGRQVFGYAVVPNIR
ncbi:unnamed protein product [Cryptosporidium hominis]|uniref:Uncharacterized protein n=1 Tax=Cryptosporidium hominis TaxID=237895 RepID=A0A0S4TIJ3_CRYHO|nr:transmembrane protein [Cryptosporidium hominis TU502]OLQ16412.1 hypothetical protein ChTU502y2012_379g0015 [Cryptosporidium hominis]PPA63494.1 hypothetical protein ChUKH1_08135 [Cryptosporidium hominis]PPS97627.1 Uncharacterized protein GY17_00000279 [Cryptosporidium hominis]CUV06697.1 unnamed protein product [Cryptosporidium hominis]|eukprot:PPS97627.1 Uncharacterized protein GY17_00000279 [Cryptosporidium hominis]